MRRRRVVPDEPPPEVADRVGELRELAVLLGAVGKTDEAARCRDDADALADPFSGFDDIGARRRVKLARAWLEADLP